MLEMLLLAIAVAAQTASGSGMAGLQSEATSTAMAAASTPEVVPEAAPEAVPEVTPDIALDAVPEATLLPAFPPAPETAPQATLVPETAPAAVTPSFLKPAPGTGSTTATPSFLAPAATATAAPPAFLAPTTTPTTPAAPASPAFLAPAKRALTGEPQVPTGKFTTAVEVKPILEVTRSNWVAVREYNGQDLVYVTHLWSWRCGLVELRVGINGNDPEPWPLPDCHLDQPSPNMILEGDGLPYRAFGPGTVAMLEVELTYDDLTTDGGKFNRQGVPIP